METSYPKAVVDTSWRNSVHKVWRRPVDYLSVCCLDKSWSLVTDLTRQSPGPMLSVTSKQTQRICWISLRYEVCIYSVFEDHRKRYPLTAHSRHMAWQCATRCLHIPTLLVLQAARQIAHWDQETNKKPFPPAVCLHCPLLAKLSIIFIVKMVKRSTNYSWMNL